MRRGDVSNPPAPTTPAEAAQLIADALNAARAAGFCVWRDGGHIMCDDAGIYEDHEHVWRPLG
jgi:hypothetical protein